MFNVQPWLAERGTLVTNWQEIEPLDIARILGKRWITYLKCVISYPDAPMFRASPLRLWRQIWRTRLSFSTIRSSLFARHLH